MHRILLHVVLDLADDGHDAGRDFWATALAAEVQPSDSPEFSWLSGPLAHALVQRLSDGESRVHLDIESDDLDAEVSRLERAGAERVERFEQWQVMRDPAGMLFCVTHPKAPDFEERAHPVQD